MFIKIIKYLPELEQALCDSIGRYVTLLGSKGFGLKLKCSESSAKAYRPSAAVNLLSFYNRAKLKRNLLINDPAQT